MMSWGCRSAANGLPAGLVTEEEFAQRLTQARVRMPTRKNSSRRARGGGAEGDVQPANHWLERGKPSRRKSLSSPPPMDGSVLNDAARRRSAVNARTSDASRSTVQALDLCDRCITRGFPT
jgi:hypothetical protein